MPELPDIGASAEGLTIIVTGPTGGIGQQSAAELARRGAKGALRTGMERLWVGVWLNAMPKRLGRRQGDLLVFSEWSQNWRSDSGVPQCPQG